MSVTWYEISWINIRNVNFIYINNSFRRVYKLFDFAHSSCRTFYNRCFPGRHGWHHDTFIDMKVTPFGISFVTQYWQGDNIHHIQILCLYVLFVWNVPVSPKVNNQCFSNSSVTRSFLKVRAVFHKTVGVCRVYCNFKLGYTCRITVNFGTLKDKGLLINTLASDNCFSYRNIFQNGVDALSKIDNAFLVKNLKILYSYIFC